MKTLQEKLLAGINKNIDKKRKDAISELQYIIENLENKKPLEYCLSSRKLELINELITSKDHIEDLFFN